MLKPYFGLAGASVAVLSAITVGLQGCVTAPPRVDTVPPGRAPSSQDNSDPKRRQALWAIIKDTCIEKTTTANPSPCVWTDVNAGYLLFQDQKSKTHHLLLPTTPVTGIEDAQILDPKAPNYWQGAWKGSVAISRAVNREVPREAIGLAINPAYDRSQDQLHIHMDCLKPEVANELKKHLDEFTSDWSSARVKLLGAPYRVRTVLGDNLEDVNPFQLLASDLQSSPNVDPIANHTLVLVGATFKSGQKGFLLLDRSADPASAARPGHRVHGEDLLDFSCAIMNQ